MLGLEMGIPLTRTSNTPHVLGNAAYLPCPGGDQNGLANAQKGFCHIFYADEPCLAGIYHLKGFPGDSGSKESACNTGDPGFIPGEGMATHSSILAWRIP